MATFNPYKEAAHDYQWQRAATRHLWRGWCKRCGKEKPLKGGTTQAKNHFAPRHGVVQRFICADCLAVKE
jgi:hypothetical protein